MIKIYPFDDWLTRPPDPDGRTRLVLVAGQHYDCSQSCMCQQLRNAAAKRHMRLCLSDLGDRVVATLRPAA